MDSGSCVMNHFIHCKDTHFPPDVQIPVQKKPHLFRKNTAPRKPVQRFPSVYMS